jgi:hypothetical protein
MAISENAFNSQGFEKVNDEHAQGVKRSLSANQSAMANVDGQGTIHQTKFLPNVQYEIVADDDISAMQINLKKDVPQLVSGATAQKLIERGRGHIKLFDAHAEAKAKEEADMKAELAELKEAVKEMKKPKAESKPKAKSTKKGE